MCFNELTLLPSCTNQSMVHDCVMSYAKTIKKALETIGTKKISYDMPLSNILIGESTSLKDYCDKNYRNPEVVLILSTHTMPQVNMKDESIVRLYDDTIVTIDGCDDFSNGLAASYVHDVPSIGLALREEWHELMHDIRVVSGDLDIVVKWPCLTSPEHFLRDDFNQWVLRHSDIDLVTTELSFREKKVKLRDDHGKNILEEHAEILCRNEYVKGVVNSLAFKPYCKKYVCNMTSNGLIDIVLYWDDRGVSMRVETTGRNIQETAAIAAILEDKYGK